MSWRPRLTGPEGWGRIDVMRIVDLSRVIAPGMPVYPGDEPPLFTRALSIEEDGFTETRLTLSTHTGTHLDAPGHVLAGAPLLESLPLERFVGEAAVIDVRGEPAIDLPLLERVLPGTEGCRFLLFRTGWETLWGREEYYVGYPSFGPETAGMLAGRGLSGVGVDAISVDPVEAGDLPAHRALLGRELLIVENLANLGAVSGTRFLFSALPLSLGGVDGSPVRAVALVG